MVNIDKITDKIIAIIMEIMNKSNLAFDGSASIAVNKNVGMSAIIRMYYLNSFISFSSISFIKYSSIKKVSIAVCDKKIPVFYFT